MEVKTIPAKKPKYKGTDKRIEPTKKIRLITIITVGFKISFLSKFSPRQKNI
jgi:hypothetical protein